jgi:hypothetical protein
MSDLRVILFFVIFSRLPFLLHPVQGDDLYYLYGAQHAQVEPAHPHHAKYVFQGREVSMLGHPHPPLNSWLLGGLLAAAGDVYPVVFHGFYLLPSLLCALAVYRMAEKLAPDRALTATLLFLAAPAFWVSGNSFEADLPLLTCLLCGMALFLHGRHWLAAVPLFLAGLAAYQAVALIPVLWMLRRGYVPACAPALAVAAYQIAERVSTGIFPVAAAAGYFNEYGLQRLQAKLLNAASLLSHLTWTAGPVALFQPHWGLASALPAALLDWHPLFWASAAIGVTLLIRMDGWLGWWVRIFFAASVVLFFAGSARYLLPLTPAVCLWIAQKLPEDRLTLAIASQMLLSGLLTMANYQHWQGYKDFVDAQTALIQSTVARDSRVWVSAEWGLRFYAESLGALPLRQAQPLAPGDLVIHSRYSAPPAGLLQKVAEETIRPALPLRLIGGSAGWSTVAFGVRPFEISTDPVDVVTVSAVVEREPVERRLSMASPAAHHQLISGFYQLENNRYRWMARKGTLLLKPSEGPLTVSVYATAPAELRVSLEGVEVLRQTLAAGAHSLITKAGKGSLVSLEVDRTVPAPGDTRELGLIVESVGFQQ